MVSRAKPKSVAKDLKRKHSSSTNSNAKGRFSDQDMPSKTRIPPEFDEDIDDDLAFDSEDERLYGHFFQRRGEENRAKGKKAAGKKSKTSKGTNRSNGDADDFMDEQFGALERTEGRLAKRKVRSSGPDEDDLYNYHEDGQSSDGSDYIDLSDMLDANLEAEEEGGVGKKNKKKPSKKKTIVAEGGERQVVKKQRASKLTEENEAFFGSAIAGEDGVPQSYSAAIRQFIKKGKGGNKEEEAARNRLEEALRNKHNLLTVDLDDPEKERFARKEVRSIVDENLSKYKPLLQELNTTKHLQLPMRAPESNPTPSSLGGIVAASEMLFREGASGPTNPAQKLTSRMNAILSRAGLSRGQLEASSPEVGTGDSIGNYVEFNGGADAEAGEGAGAPPSPGYVAKLKAILAYENARRRRFNRIKSKAYRRILRKEEDRERARRATARALLDPERARRGLAVRLARARAAERVTQRHKNTSAWVRRARRLTRADAAVKEALDEQDRLRQRLMRRADADAGEADGEAPEDKDNADASSEEERVVDELLAAGPGSSSLEAPRTTPLTSLLWKDVEAEGETAAEGRPITQARAELREMKFMKHARAREEKAYAAELASLQEDIRRYQNTPRGEGDTSDDGDGPAEAPEHAGPDRMTGPIGLTGVRKRFDDLAHPMHRVETIQLRKQKGLRATAAGPIEQPPSDGSHGEVAESEMVGKNPQEAEVVAAGGGFAGNRKKTAQSTRITITPETLKRARATQPNESHGDDKGGRAPSSSDDAQAPPPPSEPEDDLRLHQEYLVSRAFAHDEIDEDFLKEKTSQVETIMKPEDVNENLPGWGEWGGTDPKLNKRHQEKLEHSAVQRQIEKSFLMKSRADAGLDHVIINHDGVELVPDRMTLHMVPRPFSNAQEFARFIRQPLGPEWSSALSFKEGVQPRIEVRQGQAVLPLDLSLRRKTNKTKRRKIEKKDQEGAD